MKNKDLYSTVNIFSNRETAALIVSGQADVTPGTRSVATEFGLTFINLGSGALNFAVRRGMSVSESFFRNFAFLKFAKVSARKSFCP